MKYQSIVILLSAASFATSTYEDNITGSSHDVGSKPTQGTILSVVSISHLPSSSCEETIPPSSSCEETHLPSSSCEETTPPSSSCEETHLPSSSCEETTPPSSSCEETTPPSSSCEETYPLSSSEETTLSGSLHLSQERETPKMKPTQIPNESPPKTTIKAAQKPTETTSAPNKPTTLVTFVPPLTTSSAVARPPTVETLEAGALRRDPLSAAILSAIFAFLLSTL